MSRTQIRLTSLDRQTETPSSTDSEVFECQDGTVLWIWAA
jgi:hypothetical protein